MVSNLLLYENIMVRHSRVKRVGFIAVLIGVKMLISIFDFVLIFNSIVNEALIYSPKA